MTDSDLVTQLTAALAAAEERGDAFAAAWTRHSLSVATKVNAQLQAVENLLLALIPVRERGALTALVIEERMPRITASVDTAVAEAKCVADEMLAEDQQRREQRRSAAMEAGQRG